MGENTAFFNPAAFGVKFVANCLVTETHTLTKRPELVKRFKTALLAGWQQALDRHNQEEAIKTLQKYDPDTPRPILEEQLKITRELVQPDASVAIGKVDAKGWEQTERIMRTQKQLPGEVSLKTILKPVSAGVE